MQADLLVIGADLATPPDASPAAAARIRRLEPAQTARLEDLIDRLDAETPPLTTFILPGGSPGAARCTSADRVPPRRTTRGGLGCAEPVNPQVVIYLNRLSDLLFTLARWVNAREGVPEPAWDGKPG